jgi:uncharacterized delta-60 repeat protein
MNRRLFFAVATFAASLAVMEPEAGAAQGDLDTTFGQEGRVLTGIAVSGHPDFFPMTESVLIQPDGKVLVCGRFWQDGISYWYGTFILRYLSNGDLDAAFGDQGRVAVIDPGFPYDTWTVGADMALQPDGAILLIGQYTLADNIIVRRYTSSGSLDTAFGDDGTAVVPRPSEFRGMEGSSIAVQPDGRIVGVGWEFELTDPYYDALVVFRMNHDGSMDETFGPSGTGVERIVNGYALGAVVVQPDGKIVVASPLWNLSNGIAPTLLLARFNRDGSLDSSFGDAGKVTERIDDTDTFFRGAALQPDGRIVVAARTLSTSGARSVVVRYNSDGSRDAGFGAHGLFSVATSFFDDPQSVLIQPNRQIVAIGSARDDASGGRAFAILRLTADGVPDPAFGVEGRAMHAVVQDGTALRAFPADGAVRDDGRILVAGGFPLDDTIALIRVNAGPRYGRPRRGGAAFKPVAPEPGGMGVTVGR